jgi:hypothetical protein
MIKSFDVEKTQVIKENLKEQRLINGGNGDFFGMSSRFFSSLFSTLFPHFNTYK